MAGSWFIYYIHVLRKHNRKYRPCFQYKMSASKCLNLQNICKLTPPLHCVNFCYYYYETFTLNDDALSVKKNVYDLGFHNNKSRWMIRAESNFDCCCMLLIWMCNSEFGLFKSKITKMPTSNENIQIWKSLIKWQNQRLKHIKWMENKCHIPLPVLMTKMRRGVHFLRTRIQGDPDEN